MAKKQALLFELIRDEETPAAVKRGFWDQLFRKATPEVKADQRVQEPVKYPENEPTQDSVLSVLEPVRTETGEDDARRARLYIKVNNYSLALGITAILIIAFCGYILGRQMGFQAGVKQRSTEQLGAVAAQEPDEGVLKVGREARTTPAEAPIFDERPRPALVKDSSKNEGKITRKNGPIYRIIQVFTELPDAERAQAFLAGKGIETTIEQKDRPNGKGKWNILMSVVGFANLKDAKQRQESDAFRDQIKALGQQYRMDKAAKSVDFKTCLYAKWPLR